MPVNNLFQIRRGLSTEWIDVNPVLASGEPGYDISNNVFKIGDGINNWDNLKSVLDVNANPVISGLLSATSGNFSNLSVNQVAVSLSGHTHTISEVSGLQSALDNKQPSGIYASGIHNHISSDITDFDSSVSGLFPDNITTGIGTSGYLTKWIETNTISTSIIYDNEINIGIGTTNPSGLLDVAGNLVFNTFTENIITNTSSGSGIVLDINNGTIYKVTLTDNCNFTMPNTIAGKSFSMFLNTGSGNYVVSFSGVLWSDSEPPTITTTSNKIDILSFISDGNYWYGNYSQNYGE